MHKRTSQEADRQVALDELRGARYALLRTYRRDGTPVDTPIWFVMEANAVLFRTKIGPKTKRLVAHPDVQLAVCDHRGRVRDNAVTFAGRATVLSSAEAEAGNRALHERYGWQWNVVPLLKIPGVTNVHRDLSLGEKLRRARCRKLWPDSAIVRIELS
jgi:PPOX class probable F420-dependent enzyme